MSYIQDKLDEFKKDFNLYLDNFDEMQGMGIYRIYEDSIDEIIKKHFTDYHNHIVEKILHYYQENILYIGNEIPESLARISDMDRYVMLGLPADIQKILQDTNPKE